MSSVFQYEDQVSRHIWLPVAAVCLVIAILVGLSADIITPKPPETTDLLALPVWPQKVAVSADCWNVFLSLGSAANVPGPGILSKRFRLAGTFFVFDSQKDVRKAIIDDTTTSRQMILAEGETAENLTVVTIFNDHVVVRADDGSEEQLWLTFTKVAGQTPAKQPGTGTNQVEMAGLDRFGGKRVGEFSWVYSRKALLDYYSELRNEPERLVAVFDSLAPEYDQNRRITGYRVKMTGEHEFFSSVGLKESDVVRAVNTMKMTSRNRAEYYIGEFIKDRVNIFQIDIERDGKPLSLTYKVR